MRRKSGTPRRQRTKDFRGLVDELLWPLTAAHGKQFETRDDSQGRRGENFGQEFRHGFNIDNRSGARTQQHLRSLQPGEREVRVTPLRLQRDNLLDPIRKIGWARKLPGHVRVIEMTVGIDQSRQKNHFTEIKFLAALEVTKVREGSNRRDAFPTNQHRAVIDWRRANGENGASAEEHEEVEN